MSKLFDIRRSLSLILCLIFITLFACKKEKVDNSPFISATIDGIDHLFKVSVRGEKNTGRSSELFVIASDNQNTFLFALSDTIAGNYSELNIPFQAKSITYFQLITTEGLHVNIHDNADPCKLTITNINAAYVEGYFNGTIAGSSRKKITNGKFKVLF